jgi:hypothetical protein
VRANVLSFRGPALAAAIGLAVVTLFPHRAPAAKGKFTVDKISYQGWKNNLRISNGDVELIVTLDVGPRILSYKLAGGKNVFKEFSEEMGKAGEKEWKSRGGHRLWVGPEDLTRTYFPDNGPVKYKVKDNRVRLTPATEKEYGIQKRIDLILPAKGSAVRVVHRITNTGKKPTSLAPWALTVMKAGGIEIIPLPPHKPHPGPPKNAKSPKDYAPNLTMVLWPFFDFKDRRWTFGSKYITLRQDAKKGPTKIGLAHRMGWVAYLVDGTLFVKRIPYKKKGKYPDRGCNFETFTNEEMLEIESLGPLLNLPPGTTVKHTENWELIGNVSGFKSEAEIDKKIRAKVGKK